MPSDFFIGTITGNRHDSTTTAVVPILRTGMRQPTTPTLYNSNRHYSAHCRTAVVNPICAKRFLDRHYSGQPALGREPPSRSPLLSAAPSGSSLISPKAAVEAGSSALLRHCKHCLLAFHLRAKRMGKKANITAFQKQPHKRTQARSPANGHPPSPSGLSSMKSSTLP